MTNMISKAIEVRIEQIQTGVSSSTAAASAAAAAATAAADQRRTDKAELDQMRQDWDLMRIKLEKTLNEERMANVKMSQDLDDFKVS